MLVGGVVGRRTSEVAAGEGVSRCIDPTGTGTPGMARHPGAGLERVARPRAVAEKRKVARMRLGSGPFPSVCARALLPPPSIPGAGGACDVSSFNPETAATAEGTEPRGRRWWACLGSEGEACNPEAETSHRPSSGEWPLLGLGSRVGAWAA